MNDKLRRFLDNYLLAPPKCLFCGGEDCSIHTPICTLCYDKYVKFLFEGCADCGEQPMNCRCFTVAHCTNLYRLFNYGHPDMRRFIARLKSRYSKHGFRFLAARLVERIEEKTGGTMRYDCVTFVPRNVKAKRRYGFDQAEGLAKAIARFLDVPCKKLLVSTGVSFEQKRISRAYRGIAAMLRFNINKKALTDGKLAYKTVLLVDDIVTTGSSMGECAKQLTAHGVKRVDGAFIAHTPKNPRYSLG